MAEADMLERGLDEREEARTRAMMGHWLASARSADMGRAEGGSSRQSECKENEARARDRFVRQL